MDISTVIGLTMSVVAILGAIVSSGDLSTFVDVPSVLVVGVGTTGVTFIRWPMETIQKLGQYFMKSIFFTPCDYGETIKEIGALAETARRESVFALEKVPIDNAFLKKAMNLAADNRPPEVIAAILQLEIDAMKERHMTGINVLDGIGETGPAMGMIGTLIGLVIMLQNLSDPSSIGPAMAVALLTTFYGAIIANVFALPIKSKIKVRSEFEMTNMNIIVAGALGIVAGENPRLIKEKLSAFLPPNMREQEESLE